MLLGATTLGQSESRSNGNEGVLHIPQNSRTEASPSDCLELYPEQFLELVLALYRDSVGTIYQPLRSGRIRHKVNFLSGV